MTLQKGCTSPRSHFPRRTSSFPVWDIDFLSLSSLATSIHCDCAGLTQHLWRRWAPRACFRFQSLTHQNKEHRKYSSRKTNAVPLLHVNWGDKSSREFSDFIIVSRMTMIVVNVVPSVPGERSRSEKEIPIKQKDAWELKREEQKRQQTPHV